jgi:hypothetical protein
MYLRESVWVVMDLIRLVQDRNQWLAVVSMGTNVWVL